MTPGGFLTSIAAGVVANLLSHSEAIRSLLARGENKRRLQQAIEQALAALEESKVALSGPGAIDERFLKDPEVIEELWNKLLDSTNNNEVDINRLLGVLDRIWQGQGLSDEIRERQRQGVEFLVDVLYDEILWRFPDFASRLQSRVLRELDTWLSPAKKRWVIQNYLRLESESVRARQAWLMGGSDYIEPIIQRAKEMPTGEADFRRPLWEKREREGWEEVGFQFLLDGSAFQMAVVADSGYGKSTLVQEVFLRSARYWQDDQPVPFLFTPADSSGCAEEDLCDKVVERFAAPQSVHVRRNQLRMLATDLKDSGKLLLLFDALDQVSNLQPLVGFLGRAGKNRLIVTTRPETWRGYCSNFSNYTHLRLVEFDSRRINDYFGELLQRPELRRFRDDFLGVPILASLLRQLLQRGREVSGVANRSDLYRYFLQELPTREQDIQILDRRRPEDAVEDLRLISFEALKLNHLGQVPRQTARKILGESKLNDLERLHLLLSYSKTDNNLLFRHRSFQQFLAGETLRMMLQQTGIAEIKQFLFHPNWEEPVRFLAGMLDQTGLGQLLEAVLHPEGEPLFKRYYYHLRIAALCLHEAGTEPPEKAIETLKYEIGRLLQTGSKEGVEILAAWGKGWAEERLIEALKDEHWSVREAAVWALGELRSEQALKPLLEALKDEHWSVRWAAARALEDLAGVYAERVRDAALEADRDQSYYKAKEELSQVIRAGDLQARAQQILP